MERAQKLLDVKYPLITSYVEHAALFSIIGDSEELKKWVYNNYSNFPHSKPAENL